MWNVKDSCHYWVIITQRILKAMTMITTLTSLSRHELSLSTSYNLCYLIIQVIFWQVAFFIIIIIIIIIIVIIIFLPFVVRFFCFRFLSWKYSVYYTALMTQLSGEIWYTYRKFFYQCLILWLNTLHASSMSFTFPISLTQTFDR